MSNLGRDQDEKMAEELARLLCDVRACRVCEAYIEPNPVLRASTTSRLLIIGQAPGTKVHATGTPWNDASGDRLRQWLQMDKNTFYDESRVAIMPMGFCYPGKGKSGDLPPRKECAPLWHSRLLGFLPEVRLTLLIGGYAQAYYLSRASSAQLMSAKPKKTTLTENVKNFRHYLADGYFPLPHPSPRNRLWLKKNEWFEHEVIPELQRVMHGLF